ncbi:hypothetical protein HY493_00450 [Candidatus Woesearchaeota archaeon]|nr:hypothetical protein [Candidatus Woesearchaeota archaeon]
MVKEAKHKGKRVFVCERCGFRFLEKKWAGACEDWERTHLSCNREVVKHALK